MSAVITAFIGIAVYILQFDVPAVGYYVVWPGAALVTLIVGEKDWVPVPAVIVSTFLNALVGAFFGAFVGVLTSRRAS